MTEESGKKRAVALSYLPEAGAPKVVARGRGVAADRIIETAGTAGVPVHRDEKLARELMAVDLGDSIPPELYEAVAAVLVFVTDLDRLAAKSHAV